MRYKLVPYQGRKTPRFVEGIEAAREQAREWYEETEIPVLVVEAPVGGLLRPVENAGADEEKAKAKERKALRRAA